MIGIMGEALIDFIAKAGGNGVSFDSFVGGCGLNAATAAAQQDASVGFIGKISADMFGSRILEHLVDKRVMFDPQLCNAAEPSLLAFASLDAKGSATYATLADEINKTIAAYRATIRQRATRAENDEKENL